MKFENWNEFNELENEINDIIDKQITRYIAFLSNLRAGTIKNLHFTMASLCFEHIALHKCSIIDTIFTIENTT